MLWRFAGCPTKTSPFSANATIEGVVRPPSEFSITFGLFPSITATQEFVVPRSMPIAFAMTFLLADWCEDDTGECQSRGCARFLILEQNSPGFTGYPQLPLDGARG